MIDVVLSVLALLAGVLTLEVYSSARTPSVHRDQDGSVLGDEAHEPAPALPSQSLP